MVNLRSHTTRLGVLDIGSNTIHMLIVDAAPGARPDPEASTKYTVRLMKYLKDDGSIKKSGIEAILEAVSQCMRLAEEYEITQLLVMATSALREAPNGNKVIHKIEELIGQGVTVLSGTDEARLTFLAARRWYGWDAGRLLVLDIGGGFPIPETGVHYNLTALLDQVAARLREDFSDLEIWAEPGRYMCGTAVNLITRVIGENERNGQNWYFLDDGIYGTFSGVIFDQWDFKLISFKDGKKIPATFAGPSCDSLDIMFRGKMTEPLEVGDLLLVPVCGAYTSASATTFNGFKKARTVIWEEVREELGLDAMSVAV